MSTEVQSFESWAVVEIMGHVTIAGLVTEQTIAGQPLIRIDVPAVDGQAAFTKFYGGASIYCITPCDEATALAAVKGLRQKPIEVWKLNIPALPERGHLPDDDIDQDDEEYSHHYEPSAPEDSDDPPF